jgi:hypothetical protein
MSVGDRHSIAANQGCGTGTELGCLAPCTQNWPALQIKLAFALKRGTPGGEEAAMPAVAAEQQRQVGQEVVRGSS